MLMSYISHMKFIISILVLVGLSKEPRQPMQDDLNKEAIEFLQDHDAYDDVIDAFYSQEL